jgi:type I restriction-modification system DNA methylase subunit
MLDPRLEKLQELLLVLESKKNLDAAKNVIKATVGLLVPDSEDLDFRLFRDGDGKLTANSSWFFPDDEITDRRATYSLDLPERTNLDVKVFGVANASMRTISWAVGLTPNFEDEPFNGKYNVGIDFFIPESKDRVIVALSNQYVIRTIELKGKLTATFLEILGSWLKIQDTSRKAEFHSSLWNSLDLHPINKKFYEGISQRFVALRQHLVSMSSHDSRHSAQFANRLIGRVIFTWFLDRKGLIEKESDYFNSQGFDDDSIYYRTKLEPLFFEVLNTAVADRKVLDLSTPYLNGGLFEAKPEDLYRSISLTFPKNYFDEFYEFLRGYNFTTDESTSDYQQVAIDPEMLGRIFENLLAEVSEETGEQARKAKGAFYTPRLVVDFMCKEALKGYLREQIPADEYLERRLFQLIDATEREFQDQDHNWRRDLKPYKDEMIKALDELRVLDPACGSGAFPIGMMQLLVKVYGRLEARFDSHKAKLGIIERNLFGVDIEPMAVEISRLRAWLALIVDADSSATNVRPLPNLDFKFVCANTLLHLEGKGQLTFFEDHDLDSKLQDIREQYFSTQSGIKKAKLKSSYLELSAEELTQFGESKRTKQIKSFKPFEADTSAEFFDAEQMFGVSDFQVIIGNPPYVNIEKVNPAIKAIIGKYKTAFQKYDLYVLFYERALELLSPGGVLSYITSNKFLSQPYGELLREELLKYKIVNLINFNLDIFESAAVSTCIMTVKKDDPKDNLINVLEVNTKEDAASFHAQSFKQVEQSLFETMEAKNFRLNLGQEKIRILSKIRHSHALLEEICSVNLGLKAHARDGSFKKSDMLFEDPGVGRKPFFEAKDVGYWNVSRNGYIQYEPEKMYSGMFDELFEKPKLVGARIVGDLAKLRFGYDDQGMVCSHTAVILMPWHQLQGVKHVTIQRTISQEAIECSKRFDYLYLQAVMNSLVIKFYFNELMWDKLNFYPNQMKVMPIPEVSSQKQQEIGSLARELQRAELESDHIATKALRRKLDDLVFLAFDLTDHESRAIRGWLPDLDWK